MNKTKLGFGFISLGVFLYAVHFFAMVEGMSTFTKWYSGPSRDLAWLTYNTIGWHPLIVAAIFCVAGVKMMIDGRGLNHCSDSKTEQEANKNKEEA
ncbi:MAG: hypothetical protein QM715_01265 [Nibricoccus sp.]